LALALPRFELFLRVATRFSPDQLARFRRWFIAFEAAESTTPRSLTPPRLKLGRLAGRAFAQLKKRATEP
jgi:hypothetical protein